MEHLNQKVNHLLPSHDKHHKIFSFQLTKEIKSVKFFVSDCEPDMEI